MWGMGNTLPYFTPSSQASEPGSIKHSKHAHSLFPKSKETAAAIMSLCRSRGKKMELLSEEEKTKSETECDMLL